MSTCQTAKRRRKQAAMGYTNICPQRRPHYKKPDALVARRRLEQRIMNERRMSAGKKK